MSRLNQPSHSLHFVPFDCFHHLQFFQFNYLLASLTIKPCAIILFAIVQLTILPFELSNLVMYFVQMNLLNQFDHLNYRN